MNLYSYAASAVGVLLAAGCSLQPIYERPATPGTLNYPTSAAYKPATGGTAGTKLPAAEIGWRNFFSDPHLSRLLELALQNNRDLRVAALNMERVRAQYRIQRAALSPQLNIDASASRKSGVTQDLSANPGASRNHTVGLAAGWEVDFFGRLRSLSDASLEQYLASRYAHQAAEILLVSQVADQYLTILAYNEQLAVTQKTLKAAQASYQIVELQFNTGTVSELDLLLSQTAVEQAQINYTLQTRLRAQAENGLVLLVGQPLPSDLPGPVKLDDQSILADIPAGLPSDLLQRRPDILQAEAVLRAENANIGAARAAFFPNIMLTGSLGTASTALGGLFATGSSVWSFVPSLSAPVFNAGANRANLDVAIVRKNIGIAQYEKAVQLAFREVSDGLAARGTYDDQLAAQQRHTDAQQRRLELANMLYMNGADSYLNVLTAQTDLYNAQQALVAAHLNRLTSLVDLYRSLGGGWIQRTGDTPRLIGAATAGGSA